jgi:hypothetical protein
MITLIPHPALRATFSQEEKEGLSLSLETPET